MTQHIAIKVHGLPGPQGSKRHVGGGRMIESSKKVKPWRAAVEAAALAELATRDTWTPFDGPVKVRVCFTLPRPASHYRTGRNAHLLKDSAPAYPTGRNTGDIEKHVRSTHDALTSAGVWTDDSLVVSLRTDKTYGPEPGAYLVVTEVLA